jgi:hypothetical protein
MKTELSKIKRISVFFRIVFITLFIAIPLLNVIGWIYAPESMRLMQGIVIVDVIPQAYMDHHNGAGPIILHTLSMSEKIGGYLVSMIPMLVHLAVLYFLIKLFKLYELGEIFSLNVVRYIRNIGYALLLEQLLLQPIYQFLMGIVLTLNNPPGHRIASITLDQTNVGIVLVALLAILISWIMAEGCKLREEQQLTI